MDIAARISAGIPLPKCGLEIDDPPIQGRVVVLSCEDSDDQTIAPRLIAAGADLDRVSIVEGVRRFRDNEGEHDEFDLARDVRQLEKFLGKFPDFKLVIIDPLDSYLDSKVDTNSGNKSRAAMRPLHDFCKRTGVTAVVVHHSNKSATTNPLDKVSGSRSFGALPRSVWIVDLDPEDPKTVVIAPAKLNVCSREERQSMSYRIVPSPFAIEGFGEKDTPPCIQWDDEAHDATATDLLNRTKSTATADAGKWLRSLLLESGGWMYASDVIAAVKASVHSESSVRRARADAGVVSESKRDKRGHFTVHYWRLESFDKNQIPDEYS